MRHTRILDIRGVRHGGPYYRGGDGDAMGDGATLAREYGGLPISSVGCATVLTGHTLPFML